MASSTTIMCRVRQIPVFGQFDIAFVSGFSSALTNKLGGNATAMQRVSPPHLSSSIVPQDRMKVVPGFPANWSVLPRVSTSYFTDPCSTTCRKFSTCLWRGMTHDEMEYSSTARPANARQHSTAWDEHAGMARLILHASPRPRE
jgi:hypothetical protein